MSANIQITDSHCHLDFPAFEGQVDEVIARAEAAGVHQMVSIATTRKGLPQVRAIAEDHHAVFYAFGMHPLHVHEETAFSVDELLAEAQHPKMIGIGETGLDYHYSVETVHLQKPSLATHITAAQESGLPLIIHARNADEDMAEILSSHYHARPFTCVMHCFSSGAALARTALDCGFYLSMSGVATFKNAESVRDIFKSTPIERILVETDAPYLAPVPYRGKTNEPAYVVETAKAAAALFEMSHDDFAAQTEQNFHTLFPKVRQWQKQSS